MIIKKTKNYEQFKIMEWNRAVSTSRVSAIKESIERYGYIPNPIIVNEKLEVIDGQGRLQACRELGLAIYYIIIEGIGGDECIAMNCYQKQWGLKDYIDYYSKCGNSNFIKLNKLIHKYSAVQLQVIMRALNKSNDSNMSRNIKTGELKLTDENIELAKDKINFVVDITKRANIKANRSFGYALIGLAENNLIDRKRLREQIDKYGFDAPISTTESVVNALEEVYNYRKKDKVYFRDAYRMAVKQ